MPRTGAVVTWCFTLLGPPTILSMYCIIVGLNVSFRLLAHLGTAAIVQHARFTSRTCTFRASGGGSKCGAIRHFRNQQPTSLHPARLNRARLPFTTGISTTSFSYCTAAGASQSGSLGHWALYLHNCLSCIAAT